MKLYGSKEVKRSLRSQTVSKMGYLEAADTSHQTRKCKAVSDSPHVDSCFRKLQWLLSSPAIHLRLFLINCKKQLAFAFGSAPVPFHNDASEVPFRKADCSSGPVKFVSLFVACNSIVTSSSGSTIRCRAPGRKPHPRSQVASGGFRNKGEQKNLGMFLVLTRVSSTVFCALHRHHGFYSHHKTKYFSFTLYNLSK